jgi:hypothetical protein
LLKTLFKATKLTPISLSFVDFTIAIGHATVNALILHCSLEESLTPFTGDDSIMQSGGSVLANVAKERFFVLSYFIRVHDQIHVPILRFNDMRG